MWSELKMTYKARDISLSRSIRERREIWNSNWKEIYSIMEIFVLRMGTYFQDDKFSHHSLDDHHSPHFRSLGA